MKSNILIEESKTSNIKINKLLTNKYKEIDLFADKLKWAKDQFKNRDLFKELDDLKKKEVITKP